MGLRVSRPLNGDWTFTLNVAPDDWWLNATGPVGLYPTVLREEVTGQVLTEVFHHVVTLEFTVNQDVKADFFLPFDPFVDFSFDEGRVFSFCLLATTEGRAVNLNFACLWEAPDSGSR